MENHTFALKNSGYRFTPLGGPLDSLPEEHFFHELGYALAAWTRLEHMLTTIILHLNKEEVNINLATEDPPAKFKEMIGFLSKWMSDPSYAHIRTAHNSVLFDGLKYYAGVRNEWNHSTLESINAQNGDFTMCRLTRKKRGIWEPVTTTYVRSSLSDFATQANRATRHFVEIAKVIFEQPQTPEQQPNRC